jgi:outer membrane protein assembly factor BamC
MLAGSLSACGYLFGDSGVFRDTSNDYLLAAEPEPIALPEGLSSSRIADIYAIPAVNSDPRPPGEDGVPRPAPLVAASADQLVRIQRLGDASWVLVAIAPGQLWPQLRSFLSAANIEVARMDARAGIIESTYLDLQNEDRRARFRFRVERGVQRGNSELHVLQMFQRSEDEWPQQSDDLELEGEMLRGVAQFVANSADTAPVSMMAEQSLQATAKVALVEGPSGDTYIELELPYDRAWASLARSLEQSGFEITDRNRSAGEYYVSYRGEPDEEKGGWFRWLGGDDDRHPIQDVPMLVTMEETADQRMVIRMAPERAETEVAARDRDSLLVLIKGNIN